MKRSEEIKQIIPAFLKTQKELKSVKKDRVNPFAESSYATLDAIFAELMPKLNANGLMLTQMPVFEESPTGLRIGIETTLFHESGEWLEYDPFFMELEKGSKMNMAQSAGSVITYSRRYAVGAIFGISTDEDKDGVNSDLEKAKKTNKKNGYGQKEYTKKDDYKKDEPTKKKEPLTLEEAKNKVFTFGKHKDKTILEVAETNGSYMRWLLDNSKDDEIKEAVKLVGKFIKEQKEADTHDQTKQDPDNSFPNEPPQEDPNDLLKGAVELDDEDLPF